MFSQFEEERIILDFWGNRVASFLDIGAWDGIELSNTRALALKGWSGILVEPSPTAFQLLLKNTNDIPNMVCVNSAISEMREIRKFHAQSMWGGTLNDSKVKDDCRTNTSNYYVLTMSPTDLWEIGTREDMEFEFVSIDAEWMDYQVLCGCRGLFNKTELLCVEVTDDLFAPTDPIPSMCSSLGFTRLVGKTRCNIIVAR